VYVSEGRHKHLLARFKDAAGPGVLLRSAALPLYTVD